jgi:hypothetical protein
MGQAVKIMLKVLIIMVVKMGCAEKPACEQGTHACALLVSTHVPETDANVLGAEMCGCVGILTRAPWCMQPGLLHWPVKAWRDML